MTTDKKASDALLEEQAERIRQLENRLAWREDQATHRLTPEEHHTAALAALAAVEAAQRGNHLELEALAPRSVAETRAHLSTYVTALAALADHDPDLIDQLRHAILGVDPQDGAA